MVNMEAFKEQMVKRMLGPSAVSASALSKQVTSDVDSQPGLRDTFSVVTHFGNGLMTASPEAPVQGEGARGLPCLKQAGEKPPHLLEIETDELDSEADERRPRSEWVIKGLVPRLDGAAHLGQ